MSKSKATITASTPRCELALSPRKSQTINGKDISVELADVDLTGRRGNVALVRCSQRCRRALERSAIQRHVTVNTLLEWFILRGIERR